MYRRLWIENSSEWRGGNGMVRVIRQTVLLDTDIYTPRTRTQGKENSRIAYCITLDSPTFSVQNSL